MSPAEIPARMTATGQSNSERDQKIAELDKAFVDAPAFGEDRFPHVSHILGSDWSCSVLPRGPDNAAHYREAAYRFIDLRWPQGAAS
jgi:hypothetical protein